MTRKRAKRASRSRQTRCRLKAKLQVRHRARVVTFLRRQVTIRPLSCLHHKPPRQLYQRQQQQQRRANPTQYLQFLLLALGQRRLIFPPVQALPWTAKLLQKLQIGNPPQVTKFDDEIIQSTFTPITSTKEPQRMLMLVS